MKKKVLIIKLGYSETLDPEIGRVPSLGDVLRTTPILWALKEKYPDSHITWLVSEPAEPLLSGNPFIDRILTWDHFVPFQLMKEKFDVLINLEKIPGVCALTDMIDAWVKYGFRFEAVGGSYHAYEKGLDFMSYMEGKRSDKTKGYWQQVLIEMLGIPWNGQRYIIGYRPKTKEVYDVGFNYEVGSKWPVKAMPLECWEDLEKRFQDAGLMVSWQQGKNNLFEYMDWIHSCRVIISHDSLGLHMAFAFRKEVVGLFGPTDPKEIYFYDAGHVVSSLQECSLRPCLATRCSNGLKCMDKIDLAQVEEIVLSIFQPSRKGQNSYRGASCQESSLLPKGKENVPAAYGLL